MRDENSIIFKGRKDGIIIILDESIPFEQLKIKFRNKVFNAKKFLGSSDTSISFKGRALSENEEDELLSIISEETGLNISYVDINLGLVSNSLVNSSEKAIIMEAENPEIKPVFSADENITKYHKGSVRSGQSVNYSGSVVIIGDVNPGGEVIAEGNVTVLGNLKGLVHAGFKGDKNCFISAYNFQPTQLRIADIITYIPDDMADSKKRKRPSMAFIEDGQIYIEPLI